MSDEIKRIYTLSVDEKNTYRLNDADENFTNNSFGYGEKVQIISENSAGFGNAICVGAPCYEFDTNDIQHDTNTCTISFSESLEVLVGLKDLENKLVGIQTSIPGCQWPYGLIASNIRNEYGGSKTIAKLTLSHNLNIPAATRDQNAKLFAIPVDDHKVNKNFPITDMIGNNSWASGDKAVAIGDNSTAEGEKTIAIGKNGHAEGYNTIAGYNAHSEGTDTKAIGHSSHTSGTGTIARNDNQFVIGTYNEVTDDIFIVGDGTEDTNRKNIFKVGKNGGYFDGDVEIKGQIIVNDNNILESLNDIQERLDILDPDAGNLEDISEAISDLNGQISSIQNTVNENTSQLQGLSTNISTTNNNVQTLQGSMTTLQSNVINLQNDVTLLTDRVDILENNPGGGGGSVTPDDLTGIPKVFINDSSEEDTTYFNALESTSIGDLGLGKRLENSITTRSITNRAISMPLNTSWNGAGVKDTRGTWVIRDTNIHVNAGDRNRDATFYLGKTTYLFYYYIPFYFTQGNTFTLDSNSSLIIGCDTNQILKWDNIDNSGTAQDNYYIQCRIAKGYINGPNTMSSFQSSSDIVTYRSDNIFKSGTTTTSAPLLINLQYVAGSLSINQTTAVTPNSSSSYTTDTNPIYSLEVLLIKENQSASETKGGLTWSSDSPWIQTVSLSLSSDTPSTDPDNPEPEVTNRVRNIYIKVADNFWQQIG